MTREALSLQDAVEIEPNERLLKIAQVARLANVSERTVWRDIHAGILPVRYPFPRRPRVTITAARAYAGL